MTDFLPLMLDLQEKEIVIFGGGEVGERKAILFCDHSKVTVLSREFTDGLKELSDKGKITTVQVKDLTENEIKLHLKNTFIVIPATNDRVLNEKIANIADSSGIFVNRVDGPGDIIVPSIIRRGNITIGISTYGQSPGLSKYIRERIEEVITPEFEDMSRLQNEIREILKLKVKDQKKRKEILWNILNDNDVWSAFKQSYEKAYMIASKHISQDQE